MHEFEVERPTTAAEAAAAMGEDRKPLAGGQTLIPTMKARLASPEVLIGLGGVSELKGICTGDNGAMCIGAMTTHAEIAVGAFPALAQMAGRIGDPAVRKRGTIGGSLANNDPAACYPAAVLATGATVVTSKRSVPAKDYFDGLFTTILDEDELIKEVQFPVPSRAAYAKFEQPASKFAIVGVFVADFDGDVRVAVTGAGDDGVFRWAEAEAALAADFSVSALDGVTHPEDGLIGDIHADLAFRAHLVGVMTRRAVAACT